MSDCFKELSNDCSNRIGIWYESLTKVYSYLMVEKHIKINYPNTNIDCKYSINGMDAGSNVSSTARDALIESAIILFCQIYSQGKKCNGIAKNRGNPEVDGFRKSLENFTIQKLNWSNNEYSNFKKSICDMRNQFFAHYDASRANYRVIQQGLSSRRIVGCKLDKDKLKDFTTIIEIMLEYLLIRLKI